MRAQRTRISAYALIHEPGRVLLCQLSKEVPRWEGCWTLPGGELNFGERPEEAMICEVEEETGLLARAAGLAGIDSIHDVSGDHDFHGVRIIYNAEVTGGSLRHELSGSTDLCAWHDLPLDPALKLVDLAVAGCRLLTREG